MRSDAKTVEAYLDELPEDRRAAIQSVRKVILEALPKGYEEGMQYGMIGYFVPHSVYPPGYHCDPKQPLPFVNLASQKNHMAVYLMCCYGKDEAAFRAAWAKTGKRLDMGKSCVRFKKVEDLALDVISETIRANPVADYIAFYEQATAQARGRPKTARKKAASVKKKSSPKKVAKKKAPKR